MRLGMIRAWLEAEPVFRDVASFICRQDAEVYLVGGAVRDLLAGRKSYDMDLAVAGNAMGLARRVADAVGGAYVAMDPERDVARVVVRRGGAARLIDLAGLRATTIEGDLRERDFSVNAMAVPLCAPDGELLDPTGGREDLESCTLRATHAGAFTDDPLRTLRGVRLRQALGWAIEPETERLMRAGAPGLARVSPERVRDELAQMLAEAGAADALAYGHGLGILAPAVPQVTDEALARGITTVGRLETLESAWAPEDRPPGEARMLREHLGDLVPRLRAYWHEELSGGRSRWVTLKLAGLLSDLRYEAGVVAEGLHLSAREARLAAGAVDAAHRVSAGGLPQLPAPLDVFRYYRRAGEAGAAGALLALAVASGGSERDDLTATAAILVRAWFVERLTLIDPPPLLTGREVMAELGVGPGPRVGEALEALREAQVQGLVSTPAEAREYLRGVCA